MSAEKSPYWERHDREVMERYLAQYRDGSIGDYDYFKLCQLARQFNMDLKEQL